jgi:hypothetical protein
MSWVGLIATAVWFAVLLGAAVWGGQRSGSRG